MLRLFALALAAAALSLETAKSSQLAAEAEMPELVELATETEAEADRRRSSRCTKLRKKLLRCKRRVGATCKRQYDRVKRNC